MRRPPLAPVLLALLLSGCALRSTSAILQAQEVYEDALDAGAPSSAPHEFVLARQYLDKAREEWGQSQYQDADMLARKARAFAEEAEKKAIQEATMGEGAGTVVPEEVVPLPPTEETAPTEPQPGDQELLEIIQEEAPAEGAETPDTNLDEEALDEEMFEEEGQ